MNQPHYNIRATSDRLQFEFVSEGPKGLIIKRIEYTYIQSLDFWNLGFGDYGPTTQQIDDQTVSDNGDGRKVLATVVASLQEFITMYPDATVFFTGSTVQRTKVYGWAVSKYWLDISAYFRVEGVTDTGKTLPFMPELDFVGFLIYKK